MDLFDEYGAYNFSSFIGKSGTWSIVSTEGGNNHKTIIDTFKSETGEYRTFKRQQVMDQFKAGNITPVLSSIVNIPNYNKKEFDRLAGRK